MTTKKETMTTKKETIQIEIYKRSGKLLVDFETDLEVEVILNTKDSSIYTVYMQNVVDQVKSVYEYKDLYVRVTCKNGYPCLILPE